MHALQVFGATLEYFAQLSPRLPTKALRQLSEGHYVLLKTKLLSPLVYLKCDLHFLPRTAFLHVLDSLILDPALTASVFGHQIEGLQVG